MVDATTWSPTINELVENGAVGIGRYDFELDYDYWPYGRYHIECIFEWD